MSDSDAPATPIGPALNWSAEELERLAAVTLADVERARRETPAVSIPPGVDAVKLRELLEAERTRKE